MRESDLLAFQIALEHSHAGSIMCAYKAIVFVTRQEAESFDVPNLTLPNGQDQVVEAVAAGTYKVRLGRSAVDLPDEGTATVSGARFSD